VKGQLRKKKVKGNTAFSAEGARKRLQAETEAHSRKIQFYRFSSPLGSIPACVRKGDLFSKVHIGDQRGRDEALSTTTKEGRGGEERIISTTKMILSKGYHFGRSLIPASSNRERVKQVCPRKARRRFRSRMQQFCPRRSSSGNKRVVCLEDNRTLTLSEQRGQMESSRTSKPRIY